MQTWLPVADFTKSARVLRNKELGRQRVDAKMAINALLGPEQKSKWRFHPVCRMWKGYERLLMKYYEAVVREWKLRGHKHNMELDGCLWARCGKLYLRTPWWMNQPEFHESQQSALIRRCPAYYQSQFPYVPDFPPIWPVMRSGDKNKFLKPYGEQRESVPF
jgi:hypothetical protein